MEGRSIDAVGGANYPLEDDGRILELSPPRERGGGPYAVVYKDLDERWAVVALEWDGERHLAIRWFREGPGFPTCRARPVWFHLPTALSTGVLAGLPVPLELRVKVVEFLAGAITGDELRRAAASPAGAGDSGVLGGEAVPSEGAAR